jgi:hypothetical protein
VRTRTRNGLLLAILAVAAIVGLVFLDRTRPALPDGSALDAVPSGALILVRADLEALRASPLAAPILSKSREIQGLGKVKDVCGFDPLETLKELALAIPAAGDAGEFGLVGAGPLDGDGLLACASKVVSARGGRPVTSTVGSFRTVRDGSLEGTGGEIAVGDKDLLIVSGGAYLRAMVDAADGRGPTVRSSVAHGALAEAVGPADLLATMVLTDEQREAIALELGGAPGKAVSALGLGVRLGQVVRAHAVLFCQDEASAKRLVEVLIGVRNERAADYGTRLIGLGALLDAVTIEARGAEVHAELATGSEEAAQVLERVLTLRSTRHPMPGDEDRANPPKELTLPLPSATAAPTPSVSPTPSARP